MAVLRNLIGGIRTLARRQQRNTEIQEELSSFQQASVEDKMRRGMSPEAALRAARAETGSAESVRQKVWSAGWESVADSLWQDLRYAVRMLARSPGFAAVAVLTLALAIGANAAIFSVINAVLLRPLQYTDSGQLVSLSEAKPRAAISGVGLSWPSYLELQKNHTLFSSVAGLASHALTLTGHGEPADVSTIAVTPDFFSLLATRPRLGRALSPADGERGAAPVVVLSEPLWQTRFGADSTIVGTSITLDQRAFTVAGVMPVAFRTPFINRTDQVWIPLVQDPLFSAWTTRPPDTHWLPGIARLQSGISPDQARAKLQAISAGLASQYPDRSGWQMAIEPLQHAIVGDVEAPLVLLLCAVGLLLLIACANIANLLLARATARSKEMAVRIALGANRQRIARQLLTESALLGLLGGAAGVLLAWWGVSSMTSLLPASLTQLQSIHVDRSVLGFALALSVAASLIFGMAPVLHATRSDLQSSFREGSRGGDARSSQRARSFLAAAEVAIAMVLLIGAGLLIRSFARLLSVSPGFGTEHRVKAEISLPRFQYSTPDQWAAFANDLMTRVQAKPGLQDSAIAAPLPILDTAVTLPFTIAGSPPQAQGAADTADYVAASPAYFRVMNISLLRGRLFSVDDSASTLPVAIISETLAKRYFPHENPLGRQLIFGFPPHGDVSRKIVGVVADIHDVSLAANRAP